MIFIQILFDQFALYFVYSSQFYSSLFWIIFIHIWMFVQVFFFNFAWIYLTKKRLRSKKLFVHVVLLLIMADHDIRYIMKFYKINFIHTNTHTQDNDDSSLTFQNLLKFFFLFKISAKKENFPPFFTFC